MIVAPEVRVRRIDNPQTGEHMEFQLTARETRGELLRMEFVLDPGGLVAAPHVHPHQEERFEVLEGTLRVRLGDVEHEPRAGETLAVEAGTPHVPWNSEEEPARVLVEFRPALKTQELLETLFAWVNEALRMGQRGKDAQGNPQEPAQSRGVRPRISPRDQARPRPDRPPLPPAGARARRAGRHRRHSGPPARPARHAASAELSVSVEAAHPRDRRAN
jgi:quercetin dioxygenase-like cupin family protein